jgi:hypothetical protein
MPRSSANSSQRPVILGHRPGDGVVHSHRYPESSCQPASPVSHWPHTGARSQQGWGPRGRYPVPTAPGTHRPSRQSRLSWYPSCGGLLVQTRRSPNRRPAGRDQRPAVDTLGMDPSSGDTHDPLWCRVRLPARPTESDGIAFWGATGGAVDG